MTTPSDDRITEIVRAFEPWRQLHRRDAWRPLTSEGYGGGTGSSSVASRCSRPAKPGLVAAVANAPGNSSCSRRSRILARGLSLPSAIIGFSSCSALRRRSGWERPRRMRSAEMGTLLRGYARSCDPHRSERSGHALDPRTIHPIPLSHHHGLGTLSTTILLRLEHEEKGIAYDYDFQVSPYLTSVDWKEGGVHFRANPGLRRGRSDQYGVREGQAGRMAQVIQGVEYPTRPGCGRRMTYLFQIDSEDHVPYMFGDAGCGHITCCDHHPSNT